MKKIFTVAAVVAIMAGVVFASCKKDDTIMDTQVVKQQKAEVVPIDSNSVFFTSEGCPDGWFMDEYGHYVAMQPIYEQPMGEGGLSSIGDVYHVTCVRPGNTCGRVWVDINGVDKEGVYWCDPNGNNHKIDLSWRLGYE